MVVEAGVDVAPASVLDAAEGNAVLASELPALADAGVKLVLPPKLKVSFGAGVLSSAGLLPPAAEFPVLPPPKAVAPNSDGPDPGAFPNAEVLPNAGVVVLPKADVDFVFPKADVDVVFPNAGVEFVLRKADVDVEFPNAGVEFVFVFPNADVEEFVFPNADMFAFVFPNADVAGTFPNAVFTGSLF